MSTQYLIDPWLVDLKTDDAMDVRYRRLRALYKVIELQQKYGMTPVEFLSEEFFELFKQDYSNYHRDDGRELAKIVKDLVFRGQYQGQAEIKEGTSFPNNLPALWLQALDRQGKEITPPNWRRPMIIIPEARVAEWSELSLINYTTSDGQEMNRNLVCAECYEQHKHCEPDLDPWRIGAIGMLAPIAGEPVAERNAARFRLPRPLHVLPLRLSFDELEDQLKQKIHWACGREGYAYYIPEQDWRPQAINEDTWRRGVRVFPTRRLQSGRRGAVDREGRVWLWDQAENHHWDVQELGGRHVNVSPDGRILQQI